MPASNKLRLHLLVIAACSVIAILMTYPLITRFTTHTVGGEGDDMIFLWNLWWAKHSLLDLKTNPFRTDYIFYPYDVGLLWHAFTFLNGLLSIPLQYVFNLPTVSNLLMLFSFVLSGFGAFLLIDYFLKDWKSSFVGALIFAFAPVRSLTTSLSLVQWMPFYALYLFKTFDHKKGYVKHALAAGIMLGFNFLSEYNYFMFMLLLTAIFCIYHMVRNRGSFSSVLMRVSLIAIFSLPFVAAPILLSGENLFLSGGYYYAPPELIGRHSAADVPGLLLDRFGFYRDFKKDDDFSYLGIGAVILSALGWLKYRRSAPQTAFWLIIFLVFTVFSLGHYPTFFQSEIKIPLPYKIIPHLPVLKNIRIPVRLLIVSALALSVLSAYGIRALTDKLGKGVVFLILPLILLDSSKVPLQLFDCRVPTFYSRIAEDESAQAILEVPLNIRTGTDFIGSNRATGMYYQSVHGKKIFGGVLSRQPVVVIISHYNLPLIRNIILNQFNYPPYRADLDRQLSSDVVDLFGIDYIVFYKNAFRSKAANAFIKSAIPATVFYEDDKQVVYKTRRRRGLKAATLDMGALSSIPYLFSGWINGQKERDGTTYAWSTGGESVLLLNLRSGFDYEMRMRMRFNDKVKDKRFSISINNRKAAELEASDAWDIYKVVIPGRLLTEGINRVRFTFEEAVITGDRFEELLPFEPFLKPETDRLLWERRGLQWEQRNEKFTGAPISAAFDYIAVAPK